MKLLLKNDPNVKEIDIAELNEKEIFVRKATLVRTCDPYLS